MGNLSSRHPMERPAGRYPQPSAAVEWWTIFGPAWALGAGELGRDEDLNDNAGVLSNRQPGPVPVLDDPERLRLNSSGRSQPRHGWVFRAWTRGAYYRDEIILTKFPPMPVSRHRALCRDRWKAWAEDDNSPLPMRRHDMMCRIRVDVMVPISRPVSGSVVDVWSDKQLAAGGVGFFSDKGGKPKIRWIEVTHQSVS